MNLDKLYEILSATTCQLRKGEVLEGTPALVDAIKRGDERLPGGVVEAYAMPHVADAPAETEKVDLEFVVIGVDKAKAEERKAELAEILKGYPNPDRLAAGPSYIEVGAVIGDQGAAFQLFALGKVLGFWDVFTPASLGIPEEMRGTAAGRGLIMITGFTPEGAAA